MVFKLTEGEDGSDSFIESLGIEYGNNMAKSHNEYIIQLREKVKDIHSLDILLPLLVFTVHVLNRYKQGSVDMNHAIDDYSRLLKDFFSNCVKMAKND